MSADETPATEDKLKHPCFPQPTDTDTRVWRYLDLAKLIWLLERKQLYLPRLDLLNDAHEGSIPRPVLQFREQQFRELGAEHAIAHLSAINLQNRQCMYVSCWHLGNAESEAMWRLYCGSTSGVAIQTTYSALAASVAADPDSYVGMVTYIDYETEWFPQTNAFYPVMHKRSSFAHEREVRIVKNDMSVWGLPGHQGHPGLTIAWDPAVLIQAIHVNPYGPEYYRDVVESVVRQFAPQLSTSVRWSAMRAAPSY